MAKLQDMFKQARQAQGGGGLGFLSRNKPESKARAAALVVAFPQVVAGGAESALKAGADGLLFSWDGQDISSLASLKDELQSAKTAKSDVVIGLNITDGWNTLNRNSLTQIKEAGFQYILLPFNAPARLLALETKDLEKVITVPMRTDEMYPLYIRNLIALQGISAVQLDFDLHGKIGTMSIEDTLNYRAVREAVRYPALLEVPADLSEEDALAISTLRAQALVLQGSPDTETTRQHIKHLYSLLEKTNQDEQEKETITIPTLTQPQQQTLGE